jgi:hypothetical protein
MRILVRRIYRAFPELDRYSDEQCLRFVRATRKRFWVRMGHWTIIAAVGLACFFGILVLWAYVSNELERYQNAARRDMPWLELIAVLGCVPTASIVPVASFLTRDFLLRRRVRYVLRMRSACPRCAYRLIGLSVSPDHKITCPECGLVCDVDPALGELALDETGKQQYHPSIIVAKTPFWTKRRKRRVLRAALLVVLVPIVTAGFYESWLRYQASVARREKPGARGLEALAASVQPAEPADSEDGWAKLVAVLDLMEQVDQRTWKTNPVNLSDSQQVYPDWSLVYLSTKRNSPDDAYNDASRALAIRQLEEYRKSGLFDALAGVAAARRAVRVLPLGESDSLLMASFPQLGEMRRMAQVNAARMILAIRAGDGNEALAAFEQNLALSKISQRQPLAIDALVAYSIDWLTFRQVRRLLESHPDAATLDRIDEAMTRQSPCVPRDHFVEGERAACLDTAAWLFSDASRVRLGRWSPALKELVGGIGATPAPGRLGTYAQNRNALNATFDKARIEAEALYQDRSPGSFVYAGDLLLVRTLRPSLDRVLMSRDHDDLEWSSTRILIALERFRNAHGDYPQSLPELIPGQLSEVPIDPWSGKPLRYLRIDPAEDRLHRSFLLYSVGIDGIDDGGDEQATDVPDSSHTFPGTDFVINNRPVDQP